MLTAVFAHNSGNSGGGNLTNVNTGIGGFMYLFAKYDGPNYGSVVWCIAGMTGMITIPATANGYGLSGWTLFSPGIPTQQVPEGGSALALLGLALVGIEGLRRKLRS